MQLTHGHLQLGQVARGEQVLHLAQRLFHRALLAIGSVGAQFQGGIPQAPLRLGHKGLGAVAAVDLTAFAPIFRGLQLGLGQQALHLLFAEVGAPLDADALLAARGAVGGGHLQQAVGVDVKGHLHLGYPPGGRWNAGQAETAQGLVVASHLALPLKHMDFHRVLVGFRGGEHIGFAHRDRRITGNQHLHHPADRFQTQGKGADVIEHQVAQFAGEDAGLHGGSDGHHLIGIDRLAGLQGHQGAHHGLHHRHAGAAAD